MSCWNKSSQRTKSKRTRNHCRDRARRSHTSDADGSCQHKVDLMANKNILVIAAHPDDEVIGAGGTIAAHAARGDRVFIAILTGGATVQFPGEPDKISLKKQQTHKAAE